MSKTGGRALPITDNEIEGDEITVGVVSIPSGITTICANNIDQHSNGSDKCVPEDEMEKVIEDNGYTSTEDAANNLKCTGLPNDKKELCILEKLNDRKRIVRYFKTPTKSVSPNHWLDNSEIDNVQYHLSDIFKGYYYGHIHMIDFGMFDPVNQDVMPEVKGLRDIDFTKELTSSSPSLTYNGKMKSYGVVVNTDVSSGRGVHWFAIFMNFNTQPYSIEYFNSSGYDIRNVIFKQWLISLADDISKKVSKCQYIRVTDIQHQSESTANCGVYSLFYIWSRLNGVPHDWFAKNKVSDQKMILFRKYIFRY